MSTKTAAHIALCVIGSGIAAAGLIAVFNRIDTRKLVAEGEDFIGHTLPVSDARVVSNRTMLAMRHHCAWGVPGGNRYRGTTHDALTALLPIDVVAKITRDIETGQPIGLVRITREGIQELGNQERYFSRSIAAMGFGLVLCFDTRINFVPGHVEYAALYEASGHTVMVPFVCGNVSIITEVPRPPIARTPPSESGPPSEAVPPSESVPPTAPAPPIAQAFPTPVDEPPGWSILLAMIGVIAWVQRKNGRCNS
jgi:hypothetical protein